MILNLLKRIPGNYVAFEWPQGDVVSWGYTQEGTDDHAASKGVLTPWTQHINLIERLNAGEDKAIGIYPNAKAD